ncbi:sterile alpha motif domain-containing protein 9-like [Halichoeres trimaculatus]|uniref:sterile alpha motif domain-containing protein 9-like n=1 Tax=Halichoeres trimaculatus TaxID=147232 RepID=UPI003D9EFFC9
MTDQEGTPSQEEDLSSDIKDQHKQQAKEKPDGMDHSGGTCKPYPFGCYHDPQRYIEDSILEVTETGSSDLIEPCHEFKAFTNATDENRMGKFTYEVIRFASACMNNRTNGTIHFGIGDKPDFTHGQVLGVVVTDKEAYVNSLEKAINACIQRKHKKAAQTCIKPPRFVGVLCKNCRSSNKYVIEVDIVPDSCTCKENFFHVFNTEKKAKKRGKGLVSQSVSQQPKHFFVRDGSSSRDLLAKTTVAEHKAEYKQFIESIPQLSQRRKQAEEKHLNVIKKRTQGSKLSNMITGGTHSLDKSNFQQYVIVTNKSHPVQFESLGFLAKLNPTAVLDFDPESAECGLQRHYAQQNTVNVHLPIKYKINEDVQDTAEDLQLTQGTSWVFCNGGIEDESPSDIDQWSKEKEQSVQNVVSFLCRKDVLPNQKFLVVFLLLSTVNEEIDPLVKTFNAFHEKLQRTDQILCLCENEKAFTSWKDLLMAQCKIDISDRCIYELSFAEVNGTVLSLLPENRKSRRFLPCGGGSSVLLERKVERSLNTLEVLCVNQCEGGNSDKLQIEENFYKGGKVSWWNFHFSEEPGSTPFIKRDKFDYIVDTVIPEMCSLTKACVVFHLLHVPGCGGTTLAMHILWALRDRFRCAVLKNCEAEFPEVAKQVVKLLTNDNKGEIPRVPVLLMLDDFDDKEKVINLQQLIEEKCAEKGIQSKTAQVILLNCMRSESPVPTEQTGNPVFIGNDLSDKEQKLFKEKLKEIEKKHKNAETFYGFMIMKKNFKSEYVEGVARNTLKSFNMHQKHAQLLAILALLDVYCKGSSLPISLCEEFLGLVPKPVCGSVEVEEGFGKFSPLIARCLVENGVVFNAVKIIHPSFAKCCLQELAKKHNVSKSDVANVLLTSETLFQSTQGKEKLLQEVRQILVKGYHSVEEESQFSPLIQDIADETPGKEEMVLQNASKRFEKDAIIPQLLARYYYLKKRDFSGAKEAQEARGARELCSNSSDTAHTPEEIPKQKREIPQSKVNSFRVVQDLVKEQAMQQFYFQRKQIQKGFQSFFCQCRELFCIPSYQYFSEDDNVPDIHGLNQARQFLESQNADTYCGILSCLTNGSSPEAMEDIAKAYHCVCRSHHMPTVKENVNFIYANVVLGCVKPESPHIQPYNKLVDLLGQILNEPFSKRDYLPLFFIAVVLLWPRQNQSSPECRYVGEYISLMRVAYRSEIKKPEEKSLALHFFLGKRQGYEGLIHLEKIKQCMTVEQFASVWENGKIWKEEKVEELLCRAEGEVKGDLILADTCIPSIKVKIPPVFEHELRKRAQGSRVSFFIGFSMKGPVALGID